MEKSASDGDARYAHMCCINAHHKVFMPHIETAVHVTTSMAVKLPPAKPGAYWVSPSKGPIKP
jgi:hypothetical protein